MKAEFLRTGRLENGFVKRKSSLNTTVLTFRRNFFTGGGGVGFGATNLTAKEPVLSSRQGGMGGDTTDLTQNSFCAFTTVALQRYYDLLKLRVLQF